MAATTAGMERAGCLSPIGMEIEVGGFFVLFGRLGAPHVVTHPRIHTYTHQNGLGRLEIHSIFTRPILTPTPNPPLSTPPKCAGPGR